MHKNILENTLCHYCGSELPRTGSKIDKQFGRVHAICKRVLDKGRAFDKCAHPTFIQLPETPSFAQCPACYLVRHVNELQECELTRMDMHGEPRHDAAPRFHKVTTTKKA